jgi:alkanesulfonate monooxygenase SsuD/methylene tetrahydromethanopterin reductase-like flavin-dependent oxidoreductase (luciferase family)
LGFDAVWARDNLVFRSYQLEPAGTRFMDPYTTLAAIGATTERLILGLSVVVPIRHPLVTSQLLGGIAVVAGSDRLIVGVGAGGQRASFTALGLDFDVRVRMAGEMVQVFQRVWGGDTASFEGDFYQFHDVAIDPTPSRDTPILYGGSTPASVRRALDLADGWMPGRCPLRTLDERLEQLRQSGRRMTVGLIPVVSLASRREDALRAANADGLLNLARLERWWRGPFTSADDLRGLLIAGTPEDCIAEIKTLMDRGIDHLAFDFRMRPEAYDEQVAWFANEVLPALQGARRAADLAEAIGK